MKDNYVVQAKPDELKEIADKFKRQQDAVNETQQNLARNNDRLKQGWKGLGSEAYFKEVDDKLMPAVKRLAEALGEAARMLGNVQDKLHTADQQGSSGFKEQQQSGGAAAAATGAQQGGQGAGAGAGGGAGGAGDLGNRLATAGFGGGASDLLSHSGYDSGLGSGYGGLGSYSSGLGSGSDYEWTPWSPRSLLDSDMMVPSDWLSSSGLGSGGGLGGGGGGSGLGGGGSMGSVLGELRSQAQSGFGLGGTATGATPGITFSGLGGFGGAGGPRPPDFGMTIAIAAVSPFAALLGKVVKDRLQGGE